jgi:hypothetical protein
MRYFKDCFKQTCDVFTGLTKDGVIQKQAAVIRQQGQMKELLQQKTSENEYLKGQCMYHLILFLY